MCFNFPFLYRKGGGGAEFWIFSGGTQKWDNFQRGVLTKMKLWYRCKEVLIN